MRAPRPLDAAPNQAFGSRRCGFGDLPDRRGEALAIFTTIFIRPALELRSPARRLVGALADAGGRMVSVRRRDDPPAPGRRH